jgi:hypothetical protein
MRYAFALVLSALCTLSIVSAQTPAQEKPAAPSSSQSSSSNKVTYTGCLKPGSTADSWTLENAEMASAAGTTKAPGATATSGASSKMTLGLNVKPSENLKPHTNHKVEVTGTVSPAASAGGAASSSSAPRQNITVESVKMVSATCP